MPSEGRRQIIFEKLASAATTAELYVVSLTFSVLALSVQFPIPKDSRDIAEIFQAIGWIFLVFSGLAGVRLLTNLGDRYYYEAERAIDEEAPLPEREIALEAAMRHARELAYENWQERVESESNRLLPVQFWGLSLGITCLLLSRLCLLRLFGG